MFIGFTDFTVAQFTTLAHSRAMNPELGATIITKYKRATFAEFLLYVFSVVSCPLIALSLDKSKGPVANNEVVLLVIRNLGIGTMFGLRYFNCVTLAREVDLLMIPMASASANAPGSPHSPGEKVTGASESAARVLAFLREQQNEVKKQAVVAGSCYTVFCIPQLWPYQAVCIALIVSIASIGNNEGLVFLRVTKAADGGVTATGSSGASSAKTRNAQLVAQTSATEMGNKSSTKDDAASVNMG